MCTLFWVQHSKFLLKVKVKVKWSLYRIGVAQRVGRGIALLFHDRGTRRGWVVSSTPRPHFTPGKDPVPILQEAGWAPGPVWTSGKSRPHRDSIPDRSARSQSLLFCMGVKLENCALQGYYTASSGNFLTTFSCNLSVPSSGVVDLDPWRRDR